MTYSKRKLFWLKKAWTTYICVYINIFRHWGFRECFSLMERVIIISILNILQAPLSYARAFIAPIWRLPYWSQHYSHTITHTEHIMAMTHIPPLISKKRFEICIAKYTQKYSREKVTFTKNWCYKVFLFSPFSKIYHIPHHCNLSTDFSESFILQ